MKLTKSQLARIIRESLSVYKEISEDMSDRFEVTTSAIKDWLDDELSLQTLGNQYSVEELLEMLPDKASITSDDALYTALLDLMYKTRNRQKTVMHKEVVKITEGQLKSIIREELLFLIEKRQKIKGGIFAKLRSKKKDVQSATGDAAENAEAEFAKWGGKKETDPSMKDTLISYAKHLGKSPDFFPKQPWSAGFISWALQNEPEFAKSAGHQKYMIRAKKARDAGKKSGFVAHKPTEAEPDRGDIICRPRGTGDGWDNIGAKNHCDIYVGGGQMIGGNLGNTSKKIPYSKSKASMIIKKLA